MRHLLPLLVIAGIAHGQTLLHEWDFAAGIGEWTAAHGVAPLRHEDGAMVIPIDGPDPYIHCSEGHCLDLPANPRQFLRLRLSSNVTGNGEFFWTDSTEGRDAGFVAGQEIGFPVEGDEQWREIDVYPGWEGRITRLRLDAPGGEPGEILKLSRIAIYEWPESTQHGPIWSLRGDHGNWLPRGVASFDAAAEGLTVGGAAPEVSTVLGFQPDAADWLTIEAMATAPGRVEISWRDADGGEHRCGDRLGTASRRLVVSFAEAGGAPARGERVRVLYRPRQTDAEEKLILTGAAIAGTPIGEPRLEASAPTFDRAVASGAAHLAVEVRNVGERPLPGGSFAPFASVRLSGTAAEVPVIRLEHAVLQPGEKQRIEVPIELPGGAWALEAETPSGGALRLVRGPVGTNDLPAGARVADGVASLAGERIRLRAEAVNDDGYAVLGLELRGDDGWRTVAYLPAVGQLMPSATELIHLAPATATVDGQALAFECHDTDSAGRGWSAAATYRVVAADRIAVEHRLTVDRDAALYHFSGPWLRVGDGRSGAAKHEAVFPGVEYLGGDVGDTEASSSDRDIRSPGDLRAVPQRHNITIPLQAVTLPNDDLVALLWSNDDEGLGPAAVFASPNLVESDDPRLVSPLPLRTGNNHLLGLFLPSVPEQVEENSLVASEALEILAGQSVTLRSQILARAGAQVLDAVDVWIEVNEPAPAGQVADLLPETLSLSRTAFEDVLWVEGSGWDSSPQRPGYALRADVATLYRYLAWLLEEPELRTIAESRIPLTTDLRLSLHQGNVAAALHAAGVSASGPLASRRDDGTWGFYPDENRADLGERGDTNVGIIAPAVGALLRGARVTADEKLLAEGLKGLEVLRRYRVPRGAQVWEVPLHCPDILASGRACEAYNLGYELTGDRQWLAESEYWAKTALPFIYHWQHPRADLAPMRGGSIPVFGASGFTNSWFGRLVQWNGLAVAGSLDQLARDGGDPRWGQVAEDLVVSGQRQQIADPDHEWVGLYPDFWNMRTGIPGFWLSPGLLLQQTLRRVGHTPYGSWLTARCDGQLVTVVSPTPLLEPKAGDVALSGVVADVGKPFEPRFTVDYPMGPRSYLAVVGVAEPTAVRIGGQAIAPDAESHPGWSYHADMAALVIRLSHDDSPRVEVAIEGLAPRESKSFDVRSWKFTGTARGWGAIPHNVQLQPTDAALKVTVHGDDPYFSGPTIAQAADTVERVVVKLRTTQPGGVAIYWDTGAGYPPDNHANSTEVPADGAFHEVVIAVGGKPGWTGLLRRLRIDPPGGAGAMVGDRRIRLEP